MCASAAAGWQDKEGDDAVAVKFQDYYQTLGVQRGASTDEIRRAYRKLARQYHPDVNKQPEAAQRFARINEAYEVLSDPEKRSKYDQLGENWKAGQEFRPPPGYENVKFEFGGDGGQGFSFSPEGFSDFFEMFFGSRGGRGGGGGRGAGATGFEDLFAGRADPFAGQGRGGMRGGGRGAPAATEAEVQVTLDEVFHGSTRQMRLQTPDGQSRTLDVKIPRGVRDGQKIRLKGEGGGGADLLLKVRIAPDPRFERDGSDLTTELKLSPWEAALGTKVNVASIDGPLEVAIPPCSSGGQRLRLKGRGMPDPKGGGDARGDLYVRLRIVLPKTLTDEQRGLFEQLRDRTAFDPRA